MKRWLRILALSFVALIAATVLFFPLISRAFLTKMSETVAERLLQTNVELASAEIQLMTTTFVIRHLKVYHPERTEETFIEADRIGIQIDLFPLVLKDLLQVSMSIDDPKFIYATNRRGDWELADKIPLFKRGEGEARMRPLNVESIRIDDGDIEYHDGKVSQPPTVIKVSNLNLDVTRVRLPTEEDPLPAKFDLKLVINDSGKLRMKGRADFLSPKSSFDTTIKLRNLDLPPLAPYYEANLPVRVKEGIVHLDSEGHCRNDQLNSPAHVSLRDLQVEPKKKNIMGFAAKNVVQSLEDKEGNLDMDIVITGNIRNPQVLLSTKLAKAFASSFSEALIKDVPGALEKVGEDVGGAVESGVEKLKGLFKND